MGPKIDPCVVSPNCVMEGQIVEVVKVLVNVIVNLWVINKKMVL